jgi:hypothetical protein
MKKNEKKLKKIETEKMKKLKKIETEKMKKNEKKLKKIETEKMKKNDKLTVIGKKRILTKILKNEERTLFECYNDIKHLLSKRHCINGICKYFNFDIENGLKSLEEAYFMKDLYLYDSEGSGFEFTHNKVHKTLFKQKNKQKILEAKYVLYEKAFKVIQTIQEGIIWFMCKNDPKSVVNKFLEFTIDNGSKNNNINTLEQVYYYNEDNFISIKTPHSNYEFLKNITCKSNLLFNRTIEDVMVYLTNTDLDFGLRIPYFNVRAMDYDSKYKSEYLYIPSKDPKKQLKEMWWVWSEECVGSCIKDLEFITFTADYKYQLYNDKRFDRSIVDFEKFNEDIINNVDFEVNVSDSGVSDSETLKDIKITSEIMEKLMDDIDKLKPGSDEREMKMTQYENLSNDFSILMLEQQSNLLQKQSQG